MPNLPDLLEPKIACQSFPTLTGFFVVTKLTSTPLDIPRFSEPEVLITATDAGGAKRV